jgi:hypothetical protein
MKIKRVEIVRSYFLLFIISFLSKSQEKDAATIRAINKNISKNKSRPVTELK